MERFEYGWLFTCSESCKAHLVDKKTGKILKRYDVTIDPDFKEEKREKIIESMAKAVE